MAGSLGSPLRGFNSASGGSVLSSSGRSTTATPFGSSGSLFGSAGTGLGSSVFNYAGSVSISISMIESAPQSDSIATAGTVDDTSVVEDPNGDVTSETNPLGDATSFSYNSSGERTAVTDALGDVTSISYNSTGDVISVTDPDGNTTTYDYNAAGQLIRMTNPLGYSATYAYNAAGLLSSTTDPDGRRRDFFYNEAGQITAENWYDSTGKLVDELQFGYNSLGELISASSDEGVYTFTYNAQGQLIRETEPFGLWLAFSYNTDGIETGLQDSFGGDTVSTYNAYGELVSRQLTAPGQTAIGVTLDYTTNGEVNTLTRSAGGSTVGTTQYSYDNSGNVTGIAHLDASGNVLDGFLYAYDAANQVTSESDFGIAENPVGPIVGVSSPNVLDAAILASMNSSNSTSVTASGDSTPGGPSIFNGLTSPTNYTYDAGGQLIGAGSQTYQYDANGNRINSGYVIGRDNQLLSDGTWNYSYDADGNTIAKTNIASGVSWTYAYDDANQMTSATEYAAGGKTILAQVTYTYDVFGNRLQQTTYTASTGTSTVQRYGYNGQNVWVDLDGSNHLETRYLDGDAVDQILARVSANGLVAWYLTDHLGSVRDLMNNAGGIIDHRDYDAFGNIVSETNPAAGDRYGYTGREFEITTGLQYNRARYYDPENGRWTSEDPLGFNSGDINLYRYVGNAATITIDPSGMAPPARGGYAGGWWNPANWHRGLYTGDPNAPDEYYDAAKGSSGENFLANSDNAKTALNVISVVDPTPISDTLGAGISYAQGKDQEAVQELAMAAVPGALDKLGKTKAVQKLLTKADDAADAQKNLAKANESLAQLKIKCFAAGTPLITPDGEKAIEELRVGDLVLSAPEENLEAEPSFKRVEELLSNSKPVMEIHLHGQTIRTTAEHPFWVRGRGWVKAENLAVGDLFRSHDDRWNAVQSLTGSVEFVPVYNVRVADYHTYFVGRRSWGFSVWAHNSDPCEEATGAAASVSKVDATKGQPLNELLKDQPELLDELRDQYKKNPQWQGIDPDTTPVFYRSKAEVDAIRAKPGESGGHHPHGLALGGPEGQKLTITNETRTVKNPDHSAATGLQRRVINRIK